MSGPAKTHSNLQTLAKAGDACSRNKQRLALRCVRLSIAMFLAAMPAAAQFNTPPLTQAAPGQPGLPAALRNVDYSPRLDAQVPLALTFRDETGRAVQLSEYFAGRPVILALVYYRCPMLCDQVLAGLVGGLKAVSFDAGKDFNIVAVSFDTRDTPEAAAEKKSSVIAHYRREGREQGWHFLTGDQGAITALAEAVGFRYAWDAQSQTYAHASGILMLTPEGKVSRYFYGIDYAPRDLKFGLIDASEHKIGSSVDRVLLYCYHYDPRTGKYGALVINVLRAGASLTLLGVLIAVIIFVRRDRLARAAPRQE